MVEIPLINYIWKCFVRQRKRRHAGIDVYTSNFGDMNNLGAENTESMKWSLKSLFCFVGSTNEPLNKNPDAGSVGLFPMQPINFFI